MFAKRFMVGFVYVGVVLAFGCGEPDFTQNANSTATVEPAQNARSATVPRDIEADVEAKVQATVEA